MIAASIAIGAAAAAVDASKGSSLDARLSLEAFARCTVSSKRSLTNKAVIEDWSVPMMINRNVITAECLDAGTLSVTPGPMKAALSEALLKTENDQLDPAQVAQAPALSLRAIDFRHASNGDDPPPPQPKIKPEEIKQHYDEYVNLARFGECAVHTDSANARALLGTKIGSKEEMAEARVLAPALSKCLVAGATVTLNPETIRTAAGLAYYRMEQASRGSLWRAEGTDQ
jgi:hypothetical protein